MPSELYPGMVMDVGDVGGRSPRRGLPSGTPKHASAPRREHRISGSPLPSSGPGACPGGGVVAGGGGSQHCGVLVIS